MRTLLLPALLAISLSACKLETEAQSLGSLLVVNKNENNLSLIDLDKNQESMRLPTGTQPHEVAVSPSGKWAAVSNYGGQLPNRSLTIFDLAQKKVTKTIFLGNYQRPHGIEFINDKELIVTSEAAQALVKVNVENDSVTLVAKTNQGGSHMVAYCRADGKAYIANVFNGSVSVIDVTKGSLLHTIQLKKGVEGIDVSPDGKELWVANRDENNVVVVETVNYQTLATLPSGELAIRVKFLPNGRQVLVSNGHSGTLSVFDVATRKLIKDVPFFNLHLGVDKIAAEQDPQNPPVPMGIATHPSGSHVYVACIVYNLVAVVETKTWTVTHAIKTGQLPDGLYHVGLRLN
jgi:YVTN family beta-propeller protein